MYLLKIIFSYFLVFSSCKNIDNQDQYMQMNKDTTFHNWNKSTLLSLKSQIRLSNSSEKGILENRLLAFKAFVAIDKEDKINSNSVRYQFLNELSHQNTGNGDFYIIEANRSGEAIEIRNYLIYLDNTKMVDVETFNYVKGKWVKGAVAKKINLQMNNNLKSYVTKFGQGFNQDDIIITHFINSKVAASEFFLYSTLSETSGIKKIF